jgi:hypothetical protein
VTYAGRDLSKVSEATSPDTDLRRFAAEAAKLTGPINDFFDQVLRQSLAANERRRVCRGPLSRERGEVLDVGLEHEQATHRHRRAEL